jgi:hypothetical protein
MIRQVLCQLGKELVTEAQDTAAKHPVPVWGVWAKTATEKSGSALQLHLEAQLLK